MILTLVHPAPRFWRTLLATGALATGALASSAASVETPALPSYQPVAPLKGTFTAVGDDDMEGLMKGWLALFRQSHPDVTVRLDIRTSASAPQALADGTAQLSFVGRRMRDSEAAPVTKAWGHEATPIIVAAGTYSDKEMTHAEMVFVHSGNPLRRITFTQLEAIFGEHPRRGAGKQFKTWGDLGLTGEWKDRPIHSIRYNTIGGPLFLQDTVLNGGPWAEPTKMVANASEVLPVVEADKYAIGTSGIGFAKGRNVQVLAVAADDSAPAVEPTLENVTNRTYPLARVVYMFVNKEPNKPLDPAIREFLRCVLSKEGQLKAKSAGYLPLPRDMVKVELRKVN